MGTPHHPSAQLTLDYSDIDVEPEELDRAVGAPWNPNDIRVTTKPFSLRHIADMIADGELDLAPDFQRRLIWKTPQKSRLIESILLRIPLPAFYFNEEQDGKLQVVDGVQRLTAIYEFARGQLPNVNVRAGQSGRLLLEDLQYLGALKGVSYDQLEPSLRRRFDNTQIFVNVIDPQTPDALKFDIFRRINTGGSPLNGQEIRHCISSDVSRNFLKRCAESKAFAKATEGKLKDHKRMVDRELALRFYAFRQPDWREVYRAGNSLDDFLLAMTKRIDASSSDTLERAFHDFERAMEHAWVLFGGEAFRRTLDNRRAPINRALFDSWAVALAEVPSASITSRKDEIVQAAQRAMIGDEDYIESFTVATSHVQRIDTRLRVAREILKG